MRLTIDTGNSSTKVSLWQGETLVDTTAMPAADVSAIRSFLGNRVVSAAIASAVRPLPERFADTFRAGVCPLTLFDSSVPTPLANAYSTPATLGPDRLAAAAGAWSLSRGEPLLVADLGTAATIDHVSADATYMGGNISPGLRLRLEALAEWTARLPRLDVPESPAELPASPFGRTTIEAMINGAVRGLAAEIASQRALLGPQCRTFLTGGDAAIVASLLDFPVTTDPHLVGRGLNCILSYNEKS